MSETLNLDLHYASAFVSPEELAGQEAAVRAAHEQLHSRSGSGAEFTGWLDLPVAYDRDELQRIKAAAARIRQESDALVVIGIGGSYLGGRATIEALGHSFHNLLPQGRRSGPEVYFAGKELSPVYLTHLFEALEGKELSVIVISKSGTTTEPAIAFRLFRDYMEARYGKEGARRRIYATTDRQRGALLQVAQTEGYDRFVIPDDVGGRYSVLTAVGLLPIAAAGIDVDALLAGAAAAREAYARPELAGNPCYQYAAARNLLHQKGKAVELFATFEPALRYTAEWWKQLFGESEGKEQKGIFPASVEFTTDLHSMGQYIQEGVRHLFETVVQVLQPQADLTVAAAPADVDGLNFLAGKNLSHINHKAMEGTLLAHAEGGVPPLLVTLPALTPYHYGWLLYFFKKACAISGYLLGVNPFDQPGVEAYKTKMFALLGKPGYSIPPSAPRSS
jgi:glucose-6-phosphate isomerase